MPLYPDVEVKKGKLVVLEVVSAPGQLKGDLVATLRLMGFYLYPKHHHLEAILLQLYNFPVIAVFPEMTPDSSNTCGDAFYIISEMKLWMRQHSIMAGQ